MATAPLPADHAPLSFDEATRLSLTRTRLSAERTLMSWVRTAFSMISFGFTMGKFLEYLKEQSPGSSRVGDARTVPMLLILLGLVSLFVGVWEFRHLLWHLDEVSGKPHRPEPLAIIAALVGLLGVLAFAGLFVRIDFF